MANLAGVPLWIWGSFLGFIALMLALDLGVFHRTAHKVGVKEALIWSGIWIGLALVFNAGLFALWDQIQPKSGYSNSEAGVAFLTGYLIEKALSVDNIFVFLIVFAYFRVPDEYQHKVLFWGIIGALIFRALFIAVGAVILERFFWTMIVFSVFLVATGVKMALSHNKQVDPEKNLIVRRFRQFMPVSTEYHGDKFTVKIDGKRWATPLLLVLVVVEFTDVIFAVDSIPAIFAITSNPFIVFTSNVFAILGLRSLFFALSGLMQMFHYLSYGLAAILIFVGGKMMYGYVEKAIFVDWPKFPPLLSLLVIAWILGIAILASIRRPLPQAE